MSWTWFHNVCQDAYTSTKYPIWNFVSSKNISFRIFFWELQCYACADVSHYTPWWKGEMSEDAATFCSWTTWRPYRYNLCFEFGTYVYNLPFGIMWQRLKKWRCYFRGMHRSVFASHSTTPVSSLPPHAHNKSVNCERLRQRKRVATLSGKLESIGSISAKLQHMLPFLCVVILCY